MVKTVLRRCWLWEMRFMVNGVDCKAAETLYIYSIYVHHIYILIVRGAYIFFIYTQEWFFFLVNQWNEWVTFSYWLLFCLGLLLYFLLRGLSVCLSVLNYLFLSVFLHPICKLSLSPWKSASQSLPGCFSLKEPRLILSSPRAPESHFRPGCCLKAHNLQLGSLSGGKLFALRTPAAVGLRAGGCRR